MSDINARIKKRIETFVGELTDLVRGAALDAVSTALKQPLKLSKARGAGRQKAEAATPAAVRRGKGASAPAQRSKPRPGSCSTTSPRTPDKGSRQSPKRWAPRARR